MAANTRAVTALAALTAKPKVLILDIETRQHHAKVWGFRKQFITPSQVVKHGGMICFGAEWLDGKRCEFRSDFHDGHDAMIARVRDLFDEADIIVGWYSSGFDIKYVHSEILLAGLQRPTPHKDVDLYRVVRKQFLFPSYSLNYVAGRLGVGSKVKHAGQEMWDGCEDDDPKAWAGMRRYQIGDVKITKALVPPLLQWIPNMPHQGLYGGPRAGCPRCASMNIVQDGYVTKATGRYILWRCIDCKGMHEGTHRVEAVHHRSV